MTKEGNQTYVAKHDIKSSADDAAGAEVAIKTKKKRNPFVILLCVIIFLILCFALFIYANTAIGFNGTDQNKGAYAAFDDLEEDTIDVMLIGTSATSRYFIPPKAYTDEGISSFLIGAQSTPAILYDNIMKYVDKTQNPKLYVIELRNVLDGYEAVSENDVRRTTDSMKFYKSDRIEMIDEALEVMEQHPEERSFDDNAIDYYFPIIKYHSRLSATSEDEKITTDELLLKFPYNKTQGYTCSANVLTQVPQEKPNYQTEACELYSDIEEILCKLIDYCDTVDAEVLFTFSPYAQTEADNQLTLAVQDYVESRGYTCLNFNTDEMTEKIDVDWSTDMYNNNHFNYLGAEKFTNYMEKYLKKHYDLEDHRGDSTYDAWVEGYKIYKDYVADGIKYISENNAAEN